MRWVQGIGVAFGVWVCGCSALVSGDEEIPRREIDPSKGEQRGSKDSAREDEAAAKPAADESTNASGLKASPAAEREPSADAGDLSSDAGEPEVENPTKTPSTAPDPDFLVPATGPCPEFRQGRASFMPDGRRRDVELSMSDRAGQEDGALIFAWFATAGTPAQTLGWIGTNVISELENEGGIIVAPYGDQAGSTRPWYYTPGGPGDEDRDLRLMDEVVACARESVGIDLRRIHAIGMSAGGLQTTQVAFRRSGYIASVAIYSGGLPDESVPPDQDPDNRFAAMVLYGGTRDISPVDGIPYEPASNRLVDALHARESFVLLCNHGGGHTVPGNSQSSVWRFFVDHPFGTVPSPYVKSLPDGFIGYCQQ